MLNRILAACLAAGILAGLATAILQEFTTTPLIIKAEAYETGDGGGHHHSALPQPGGATGARLILAHVHSGNASGASPEAETQEWAPADGIERTFYTSIATIGASFGFALMLLSAMFLTGSQITARTGLAWGAAAFVATGLAPALGLSPELPGSAAAELAARQYWWIGTVIATAIGLFLALRISTPIAIAAGLVLLIAPHVIGAPHPHEYTSGVPSELSGHFAASSLVVHAVMWTVVGVVAGYVWQCGDQTAAA